MTSHRIAAIPGDGIGKEVMPEGLRVLDAAARRFGITLQVDEFDFASCDYLARHGSMMPDDWKDRIGGHDAITSVPWAGRPPCPTMSRCGAACSSSGATSISTSTCAPRA